MYSKLDIELIRIFGRKDLSFGCIYYPNTDDFAEPYFYVEEGVGVQVKSGKLIHDSSYEIEVMNSLDVSILGHIPHLEDVFRVAEEMGFGDIYISSYRNDDGGSGYIRKRIQIKDNVFFYNPTLPLLEQSEETKQNIITLFKQGN